MKKIVTLSIDETLKNRAKELGINLSGFLERKLQEYIAINDPDLESINRLGVTQLNIHTIPHIPAFNTQKKNYEKWLISRKLDSGYIKDLVHTLTKFIREDITQLPEDMSEMNGIGVRSYIQYLVQKSLLTDEEANGFRKKIPLRQSRADNFIPSNEEVITAYNKISDKRFKIIFKLLAYSGARITELHIMLKEYDPSKLIVNEKFAKYQLFYNRGHKKSFYIYIPKELIPELHKFYVHVNTITNKISQSGLNPKYLRKWFYNYLIFNNLPEGVADFIEGRAPESVGSMHYLSKAKQADYWYEQIVDTLSHTL